MEHNPYAPAASPVDMALLKPLAVVLGVSFLLGIPVSMATFFAPAAVLPCGLGLLVFIPVMIASVYVGFRDVFFVGVK